MAGDSAELAPEHAAGETTGKGAPLPFTLKTLRPLAAALRAVPDPRSRNRFHPLPAILCCLCIGLLCERQLSVEPVRSETICFAHAQSVVRAERKVTHKKSGEETFGVRHYIGGFRHPGSGRHRRREAWL